MKSLNIDSIFPWEMGVIIIIVGILMIIIGTKQSKKPFDIDSSPLIKPTSKILFGSVFVIIGFIQLIPLLN